MALFFNQVATSKTVSLEFGLDTLEKVGKSAEQTLKAADLNRNENNVDASERLNKCFLRMSATINKAPSQGPSQMIQDTKPLSPGFGNP